MGLGAVTNHMMSIDAKIRHKWLNDINLSDDYTTQNLVLLHDPLRRLVIDSIYAVWTEATGAVDSTVNIGTAADEDAVVDAFALGTTSGGVIQTATALTLTTTLQDLKRYEARGKNVLPAATPLFWDSSASGGAGIVDVVVGYYVIDRDGKIE